MWTVFIGGSLGMEDAIDVEVPRVTPVGDGANVLVRCRAKARLRRPRVYLTQWSCGSSVVQSEWKPWPTDERSADIDFVLPASCLDPSKVVRLAVLVGPDLRDRKAVWTRMFQPIREGGLVPIEDAGAVSLRG
jgi:hypothetical protein